MDVYSQIVAKQIEWAKNNGIELIDSKVDKDKKVYTKTIDENLFLPLSEEAKKELIKGDGGELKSNGDNNAKIQALHSSSALTVNIFEYWRNQSDLSPLFKSCRLLRANSELTGEIIFESKFPINNNFRYSPNLDVVFILSKVKKIKAFAIECKFTEPYSSYQHGGIKQKYFIDEAIWKDLPFTKELAQKITPNDNHFKYLNAAQLIKHILGLNKKYGHSKYKILYLWYDAVGEAGFKHQQEANEFMNIVKTDGVLFYSITYQELIMNLAKYRTKHSDYIEYITERYL